MLSDLRFALRTLARNRSFTLVTVLTLALGIGSAASIFSVTDWILFRSAQFPTDVYLVGGRDDSQSFMPIRFDYMTRAYEEQTSVMSAFAKAAYQTGNIVIEGQPVSTSWIGVGANFFPMLGITPALGRGFLPGEDIEGADQVVVVSDNFWRRHLGGRPEALGRKIRALNPWPGTFTLLDGAVLKVLAADPSDGAGPPGTVLDEGLLVAAGAGALRLTTVQAPGRAPLAADAFLRGRRIAPGTRLG